MNPLQKDNLIRMQLDGKSTISRQSIYLEKQFKCNYKLETSLTSSSKQLPNADLWFQAALIPAQVAYTNEELFNSCSNQFHVYVVHWRNWVLRGYYSIYILRKMYYWKHRCGRNIARAHCPHYYFKSLVQTHALHQHADYTKILWICSHFNKSKNGVVWTMLPNYSVNFM